MSQTTAPQINMDQGDDGLIAEAFDFQVESKAAAVSIPFGWFVAQGTAQDQVKLPAAATDVTGGAGRGIAVQRDSMPSDSSVDKSYVAGDTIPVLRKGKCWVKVESAVSIGGAAFVNWQNGNEGQFRHDADGGNASQLPGAYYRTAAGAGELAIVEINLPQ